MDEISQKIKTVLARKKRLSASGEKKSGKKIALYVLFGLVGLFLAGVIFMTIFVAILSIGLPDVHDIDKLSVAQSTTIYDRDGNVLYVKHGDENREYVSFDEISQNLIDATVAIEDDEFWEHQGFDIPGIIKAGMHEVFGVGARRGGSTITQQYVKNAFLTPERSYIRKLKEIILSVRLEQAYDKKTILELYLNKIPYGNTAYGVQKAAEIYFNKNASELDIAESAVLASLPQAPSYYNPYGTNRESKLLVNVEDLRERNIYSLDLLEKGVDYEMGLIGRGYMIDEERGIYIPGRADLVLRTMYDDGYITGDEKDAAWEKLQNIEFKEHIARMDAPHFVFYVIAQLEDKYGKEVVEKGGLQVYTTIDPDLQEAAETAVSEGAAANARFNATNASLVAMDPDNGQILAMVGSKDYYDEEIDGNVNIATSYRQPGSSFKPYVYAQAFYNRYAPASVVYDVRTQFGAGSPPDNYDGTFRGPMPMRRALGQSRNIPAIKAYFLAGQQKPIMDLAERMGIQFLTRDRDYGWPLALGTAEVRLVDHVAGFAVFANGGKRVPPEAIIKVQNAQGDILEEFDENKSFEEVLDPQIAYLITHILSDTGVRLGPNLTVPGQMNAAKTGTSNKKVNNINIPSNLWTMGYTTHVAAGAWAGNSDDRKSGNLAATANGYEGAAPIWKSFMTKAHEVKGWSYEEFPRPSGIQEVTVSAATGKLPGANIPPDGLRTDIFASFALPTEVDNSFAKVEVDTRNDLLANEFCPKEYVEERTYREHHSIDPTNEKWESAVRAWAAAMAEKEEEKAVGTPPTETSPLCNEEHFNATRSIKITDPSNYTKIESGTLPIEVKVKSDFPVDKIEFYLDGTMQNIARERPFTGSMRISHFLEPGTVHTIRAVLHDIYGYTAESSIEVRIKGEPAEEPHEEEETPPEEHQSPEEEEVPQEETPIEEEQPV